MSNGMSHFVLLSYSSAIATFILFPLAFIFQRKQRAALAISLLCKFFILSLVGITVMQNCVLTGVDYSSPTLASTIITLTPVFTFLLAVIFRMEKVEWKSSRSPVKVLGTFVSISRALIVILYKGPPIVSLLTEPLPLSINLSLESQTHSSNMLATANNWVIGGLLLVTASLSISTWNVSQAAILKDYPSELTALAFFWLFGTIQCTAVSLIAERNHMNAWKLRPDIGLISVIYCAVFGNVVTYGVITWCIRLKGPVFIAMFKPLGIAIAALIGVVFLGDILHVGSVVGAIVIVIGFYGVIWAQSKEEKDGARGDDNRLHSSSQKTPLLQGEKVPRMDASSSNDHV